MSVIHSGLTLLPSAGPRVARPPGGASVSDIAMGGALAAVGTMVTDDTVLRSRP